MQNQIGGANALALVVGSFEDPGGMVGGLLRIDLPADDPAAVDVEDEVEEGPTHGGG